MVCLKALALSIVAISVFKTTATLASPVDRGLDVSADDADHIPGSGTHEQWRAAARNVQVTDLYVTSSRL